MDVARGEQGVKPRVAWLFGGSMLPFGVIAV